MPPRHIPQRTCVACRSERPKREMVRIVRAPDGAVGVDLTGKRSGRGAYLCLQPGCWQTALKRHALDKALKRSCPRPIERPWRRLARLKPRRSSLRPVTSASVLIDFICSSEGYRAPVPKQRLCH